ncbi:MAG: hypothetical protein WBW69_19800 [Candidatus Korobacteraceae bacterium]
MRNRRLLANFALVLLLGYGISLLCISAPEMATMAQRAPDAPCGGCHHHQHTPAHGCCAAHQLPAAMQAAPDPAHVELAIGSVTPEDAGSPRFPIHFAAIRDEAAVSPPAVLRI